MAEIGLDISREFPKQLTNDKVGPACRLALRLVRGDVLLYCRHPHSCHALASGRRVQGRRNADRGARP